MIFNYNGVDVDIIDKADLKVDSLYQGDCRNSSVARWNGKCFEYTRYKFGTSYEEEINHPEDDDGHDVFCPYAELVKE